jgi:hypothetical protein
VHSTKRGLVRSARALAIKVVGATTSVSIGLKDGFLLVGLICAALLCIAARLKDARIVLILLCQHCVLRLCAAATTACGAHTHLQQEAREMMTLFREHQQAAVFLRCSVSD